MAIDCVGQILTHMSLKYPTYALTTKLITRSLLKAFFKLMLISNKELNCPKAMHSKVEQFQRLKDLHVDMLDQNVVELFVELKNYKFSSMACALQFEELFSVSCQKLIQKLHTLMSDPNSPRGHVLECLKSTYLLLQGDLRLSQTFIESKFFEGSFEWFATRPFIADLDERDLILSLLVSIMLAVMQHLHCLVVDKTYGQFAAHNLKMTCYQSHSLASQWTQSDTATKLAFENRLKLCPMTWNESMREQNDSFAKMRSQMPFIHGDYVFSGSTKSTSINNQMFLPEFTVSDGEKMDIDISVFEMVYNFGVQEAAFEGIIKYFYSDVRFIAWVYIRIPK